MDDRFDERDEIGRGGMCTVVRAYDRVLLRDTAHKVLNPRYLHSPKHIERFVNEARMTGQLEHPNIVPVHAFGGATEGGYYINMKLVEGQTLDELVDADPDERLHPDRLAEAVQILLKVCDALSFAHSRGVVHRDLKPQNIMVGRFGEVYLMDWGVALAKRDGAIRLSEDPRAERPDSSDDVTGTPAFMSPEQISGDGVDERTDVFALGATLYYVLAGRPPYPGPTAILALTQAMECAWTPLWEILDPAKLPPGIGDIVDRAMRRSPSDRYPTVRAMKRDLEAWLRGRWHLPIRTYPEGAVIVREGDEGDEAFLIVAGTCQATTLVHGEPTVLSEMGPGDVFGEMAIFSNRNRTSTVTATTPLSVQVVTRATLSAATGLDSWVGKFVTALANRFLDAEARLLRQLPPTSSG